MSYDGTSSPRCEGCQSLERHRAFRSLFERLRDDSFARSSVLQFSPDRSCDPAWFGRYELSDFEAGNPIDLQSIDRPDARYDIVICNHVLEHVERDRDALRELVRVTNCTGFVFLSFPDPLRRDRTEDWGFPDPARHGHYRHYGRDVRVRFAQAIPAARIAFVETIDPVTGFAEGVHLIARTPETMSRLLGLCEGLPCLVDAGDVP